VEPRDDQLPPTEQKKKYAGCNQQTGDDLNKPPLGSLHNYKGLSRLD
jgi:hypothetical protein